MSIAVAGDGAPGAAVTGGGTFLGHPVGLAWLFGTEVWERFAYYGMRALLVLYLTEQLLQPGHVENVLFFATFRGAVEAVFGPLSVQAMSSQIYGLYSALVFLTPVFGGLLADRVLGQHRTVIAGAVLMGAGEFLLAASEVMFLPALLLIILGNGCFKPNVSTQVGSLYAAGDPRRDRAFSIFYVAINLGSAAAPIVCGTIGEIYGWRYGFFASGIGMVIGLLVYLRGRRFLPADSRAQLAAGTAGPATPREDRQAVLALVTIAFFAIFFFATYEQKGNTFNLWIRDHTDRSFFGLFELRTTWFQSVNAILIFTLTPFLVRLWGMLGARGIEPPTVAKMAIGCGGIALAYCVLAIAAAGGGTGGVHWSWSLLFLLVLTLAELCILPIGMSLFSKLAPLRIVSMMMGVWMLGAFAGNYLGGILGVFWQSMGRSQYWSMVAAVAMIGCIGLVVTYRPLQRVVRARTGSA